VGVLIDVGLPAERSDALGRYGSPVGLPAGPDWRLVGVVLTVGLSGERASGGWVGCA
jgi:hypothetical protein